MICKGGAEGGSRTLYLYIFFEMIILFKMSSFKELQKYIRFQLNQLRSLNKHHEFEHLTRQFARLRICENIIPATGPVGSGGDQGRDFESYRSYLSSTPIATSTFLGLATDKKIIFACSLNKKIKPKIKSDAKIILKDGEPIDSIYYFCEVDLPIGERNKLKKWCLEQYNKELEILDGQTLSEQLTELDVFWIAVEYLDVPSELYPRINNDSPKYSEYKLKWLSENKSPYTYRDFLEIKYGIRQATFDSNAKPDLTRWMRKVGEFIDDKHPPTLARNAAYEICVASLRGHNDLTKNIQLVEKYFSDIENLSSISELQDATTLLSYCSTAYSLKHFIIDPEILHQWTKKLVERINYLIESAQGHGYLCNLLFVKGRSCLLPFQHSTEPVFNLEDMFDFWFQLIDKVDNAPLFPLEYFADYLNVLLEFVGDHPKFIDLTRKIDELLSKRTSGYIAAEKCRDRAITYYKSGRYLQAIKQLHKAKINWFTSETLRGSLMSMLLISDCYRELGLSYAAKYYILGVIFAAINHEDDSITDLIPEAFFDLGNCCYQSGEWCLFVQVLKLALNAHIVYDKDPLDISKNEYLEKTLTYYAILRTLTGRLDERLSNAIDELFNDCPLDEIAKPDMNSLVKDEDNYWSNIDINILWNNAQEELNGRPYCELGEIRTIHWKALGIDWYAIFENNFLATKIAEGIVSTIQIIIADLADRDLCLLPTKVQIEIRINENGVLIFKEKPTNDLISWEIGIPKNRIEDIESVEEIRTKILTLAITIFGQCSTLGFDEITKMLKIAFSDGLDVKTFIVRPYNELYTFIIDDSVYERINRKDFDPLEKKRDFLMKEHRQLKWIDGPGPGYSLQKAQELLKNRYEKSIKPIKLTLHKLMKNKIFKQKIKALRNEGYLDWQILQIIANIVADYRGKLLTPPNTPFEAQTEIIKNQLFRTEEETDIEVPVDIFTDELIEIYKSISIGAVAITWGLVLYRKTPDIKALKKLLDKRYNNSTDDIQHDDFFFNL